MTGPPSYVYCVTNSVNGKRYVGKTNNPKKRWQQHKRDSRKSKCRKPFERAIRKYGPSKFTFTILHQYENEDLAYDDEDNWIEIIGSSVTRYGYNCRGGGKGGRIFSAEAIAKMSRDRKGRHVSEQSKKNIREGIIRSWAERNETTVADILTFHAQGLTNTHIGQLVGRSATAVQYTLDKSGLSPNGLCYANRQVAKGASHPNFVRTSEIVQNVVSLRDQGSNWRHISSITELCQQTVRRAYEDRLRLSPDYVPKKQKFAQSKIDILYHHGQGRTNKEIAAILCLTAKEVSRLIRKSGLVGHKSSPSEARKKHTLKRIGAEVFRLKNAGHTWQQICKLLKCDHPSAKRCYEEMRQLLETDSSAV